MLRYPSGIHPDIVRSHLLNIETIFPAIIEAIEYEYSKPARTIQEIKERENMVAKGLYWELFCRDYLLHKHDRSGPIYEHVWLFKDYVGQFNIETHQDNGIDIIGLTHTGEWHAVQCKYRRGKGRVTWKSLSTFVALSNQTNIRFEPCSNYDSPNERWSKRIVMTNCKSVSNKKFKLPGDEHICYRSFAGMERDHWERMVGMVNYQRLGDPIPTPNLNTGSVGMTNYQQFGAPTSNLNPAAVGMTNYQQFGGPDPRSTVNRRQSSNPISRSNPRPTVEEVRRLRLQHFN